MSAADLTTRLTATAQNRHGLRPARPMLLRRVQELLREADGDKARVELVVRWIMAQEAEGFRANRLTLDKFYAVGRTIGCPDGAWAYRLWEYELALAEDTGGPSRLRQAVSYWLGVWQDADLVADPWGRARAREMLELLREVND